MTPFHHSGVGLKIAAVVVVAILVMYRLLSLLLAFISHHPDDCTCEECEAYRERGE